MVPEGLGTALKPAYEPIIVARKPISEKNIAANVLQHGTGALNIDASRIGTDGGTKAVDFNGPRGNGVYGKGEGSYRNGIQDIGAGRWPANVVLDEAAAEALDRQSGVSKSGTAVRHRSGGNTFGGDNAKPPMPDMGYGDTGGASRFFKTVAQDRFLYCPKASRRERNMGLPEGETSNHPTVKPLALMEWLITLVTPPGGIVLDPFAGSGSTLVACAELGIPAIGIEMNEEYAEIAAHRVRHAKQQTKQAVLV